MGHLDEGRGDADASEVRFRLVEVFVGEHPKADALALRLAGRALEREAVVTAFLHSAQPDRVGVLVAHDQPQHLDIEVAAGGQVARREREMTGARDVERRIEIGLRKGHCSILFDGLLDQAFTRTPVSCTTSPHSLSSRSIMPAYSSGDSVPGS